MLEFLNDGMVDCSQHGAETDGGRENRLSFYDELDENLDKLKSQSGCVCDGPNLQPLFICLLP